MNRILTIGLYGIALSPLLVLAESPGRAAPVPVSRAIAVGDQVITRYAKPLKVANQVVDRGSAFRIYRVAQVKGDWLWLESGRVAGWIEVGNVVPFSQAADHFTREISVGRKKVAAYTCRGIVRHGQGEYDLAIADYSAALKLDSKLALAFCNRGLAWQAKGDYDQALADYNEAIRLNPKYALAYRSRASAWHANQDFDQAIADCDEALRLEPEHALAYHNRGLACCAKQEYDQAIADCSEAIRLDAALAAAYHTRGLAWHALHVHDRSIADYDEAIRLAPDHALAYHNRAAAWLCDCDPAHRDGKRARESATRACELSGWSNWRYLHTLAAACAETGDFDKAIEHGARARSLAPPGHRIEPEQLLEASKARQPRQEQAVD